MKNMKATLTKVLDMYDNGEKIILGVTIGLGVIGVLANKKLKKATEQYSEQELELLRSEDVKRREEAREFVKNILEQ